MLCHPYGTGVTRVEPVSLIPIFSELSTSVKAFLLASTLAICLWESDGGKEVRMGGMACGSTTMISNDVVQTGGNKQHVFLLL